MWSTKHVAELAFLVCSISAAQMGLETVVLPNSQSATGMKESVNGSTTTILRFSGIKYANCSRFAEATLLKRKRTLNATKPAPMCYQPVSGGAAVSMEEDCLYLNIITQSVAAPARPVLVYIHGGGFSYGTSNDPETDGAILASRKNIVVVSINYRIGLFGFLSAPSVPANLGFRDQMVALQWIKKNIADFGGDPNLVTISGNSAGAMSVSALVASPLAKGLFSGAISMSGVLSHPFAVTRDEIKPFQQIMRKLGNCTNKETIKSCLLTLQASQILHIASAIVKGGGTIFTVIDGEVITAELKGLFQNGVVSRVPYLLGIVKEDGTVIPTFIMGLDLKKLLLNGMTKTEVLNFVQKYKASLPLYDSAVDDKYTQSILSYYYRDLNSLSQNVRGLLDLSGDVFFKLPVANYAAAHSSNKIPTFMYMMESQLGRGGKPASLLPIGMRHSRDVLLWFGTICAPSTPAYLCKLSEQNMSNHCMDVLDSFVRKRKPKFGSIEIPELSVKQPKYLRVDKLDTRVADGWPSESAMHFWTRLLPAYLNSSCTKNSPSSPPTTAGPADRPGVTSNGKANAFVAGSLALLFGSVGASICAAA